MDCGMDVLDCDVCGFHAVFPLQEAGHCIAGGSHAVYLLKLGLFFCLPLMYG